MLGAETCWSYFLHLLNIITLVPVNRFRGDHPTQSPLLVSPAAPEASHYPIFEPPNAPEGKQFLCEYPELPDYEPCSRHNDRGCWLRPKDPKSTKRVFNIQTDYENFYPKGVTRKYTLDITNQTIYPDGCKNSEAKLFNTTYPGPWIEACWGDDVEVTVLNHLPCNGTSVHWHGLRQYHNVEYDGVNAVTQCPIAPGSSYTYKFHARQYGTTWYHSHYSLQYPDGLVGPLTIHGPSSANYDASKDPILMTDWNQCSAFQDWPSTFIKGANGRFPLPFMTSILLNGHGVAPDGLETCTYPLKKAKLHTLRFDKGVRYLLRLINTSVDTTFVFSIDGHKLTVVEADFVPIHNYTTDSVLVGIGQRYHVIVEAKPEVPEPNGNYWIRTTPATGCATFKFPYNRTNSTTGIVRYGTSDLDPTTQPGTFPIDCSDEPYDKLKPILNWTVPAQVGPRDEMDVTLTVANTPPYFPNVDGFQRWQLHKGPLWLNFSDPTLLDTTASTSNFSAELSVTTTASDKDQWFELLITGPGSQGSLVSHPIHLHGHDFALLAQGNTTFDSTKAVIKRDNPPRRDVALLPRHGYLLIAFKVDNPGVWLMHCHIAWHASSGLAMQILENTDRIKLHDRGAMVDTCASWNKWYDGPRLSDGRCNAWDQKHFQDDSGI